MATTTKPVPVRIPVEILPRLDEAARKLGTNRARLIAFCAQTFAEQFAREGAAMMPPNWEEIFAAMDGRRKLPAVDKGDLILNEPKEQDNPEKPPVKTAKKTPKSKPPLPVVYRRRRNKSS